MLPEVYVMTKDLRHPLVFFVEPPVAELQLGYVFCFVRLVVGSCVVLFSSAAHSIDVLACI